jgi:NADH-quinone oxidoreductase subunit I
MIHDYELANDNRQDLIWTKEELMAPLMKGMEQPPHPMRLGDTEQEYYVDAPRLARKWGYPDPTKEAAK